MEKVQKRLCRTCGYKVYHHFTNNFFVSRFIEDTNEGSIDELPSIKTCPQCRSTLRLKDTYRPKEAEILSFFFEAMKKGWVVSENSVPGFLPGYEMIDYQKGILKLIDHWYKTPGDSKSAGSTHIYYGTTLLWIMNYRGHYKQEAVPAVLSALLAAYESSQFVGGRGLTSHRYKNLSYVNTPIQNTFAYAYGSEEVFMDDVSLGTHTYDCQWML